MEAVVLQDLSLSQLCLGSISIRIPNWARNIEMSNIDLVILDLSLDYKDPPYGGKVSWRHWARQFHIPPAYIVPHRLYIISNDVFLDMLTSNSQSESSNIGFLIIISFHSGYKAKKEAGGDQILYPGIPH